MALEIVSLDDKQPARRPDAVLEAAKGEYSAVLVLGYTKDGEVLDARASLNLDAKSILFMMEQFKHALLSGEYDEE